MYNYFITGTTKVKNYIMDWKLNKDTVLLMKDLSNFDIVKISDEDKLICSTTVYFTVIENKMYFSTLNNISAKMKKDIIKILNLDGELTTDEVTEIRKRNKTMLDKALELQKELLTSELSAFDRKKKEMALNTIKRDI